MNETREQTIERRARNIMASYGCSMRLARIVASRGIEVAAARKVKEVLADCRAPIEALWDCTCEDAEPCERCDLLRRIDEALA